MFNSTTFWRLITASATEYRGTLQAMPDNSRPFCLPNGFTLFHQLPYKDWFLKMEILFQEARRLQIDPNSQFELIYRDTPLHLYIANENKDRVKEFLTLAPKYGYQIDLNLQDNEEKTPFFLAVKMGNFPLEILESLITIENYNKPDNQGITPIMIACAIRRIDIIKLILQYAYKHETQSDEQLDFNNLSDAQRYFLASFINTQRDPGTGKTLGHFAVMRHGTNQELLQQSRTYQQTVSGICKSVGIDPRRDENAPLNSPLNDEERPLVLSEEEVNFLIVHRLKYVLTELTLAGNDVIPRAVLASKKNDFIFRSKTLGEKNEELYKNLPSQVQLYSGISYGTAILSRTEQTITFLIALGLNLAARQKNGKILLQYIEILSKPQHRQMVTDADATYLFPLLDKLTPNIEQKTHVFLC